MFQRSLQLLKLICLCWAIQLKSLNLVAADADTARKVFKDADGQETLIAPFQVPKLSELEENKKWVAQRVVDADKLFEEYVQKNPPLLSVKQAQQIRNNSTADNNQLLNALRRIPSATETVDYTAKIIRRLKADVKSTNAVLTNTVEESDLHNLIGLTIFGFDWELRPFAVAEYIVSWDSSADGECDRVRLRSDATWSDGKPVTAHDIAFTWRLIMHPQVPIPAVRSGADELAWVEAYDDQTLVFFHKKNLATNVWNMNFPVIPRHIYQATWTQDFSLAKSPEHRRYEEQPITAGPYEIVSRIPRQEIVLRRRAGYYEHQGKAIRKKPYFEQVTLKIIEDPNTALLALKRGDVDELEISVQQWKNQTSDDSYYARNTKLRDTEWTYFYFGWNNKHHFFEDRRVREAMAYAFPHDVLLNVLNHGLTEPCMGVFHPSSQMYPQQPLTRYKQDMRRATQLLREAGWVDTDGDNTLDKVCKIPVQQADGSVKLMEQRVPFDFVMLCATDPLRIATCNLMKNSLEKLGIRCLVRPLETTTLFKLEMEHKFEAYFGGWGTGADPDTSENIWTEKAINDGRNFVQYANPYVDGCFLLGKELPNNLERRQAICDEYQLGKVGITAATPRMQVYAKIHELIYLDQPVTFLYYRNAYFGFSKELLGFQFSPRGPYHFSPGFGTIWKADH